jgi:spartin
VSIIYPAVKIETQEMSQPNPSPYSNLSSQVKTAMTDLQLDTDSYHPQNANELLKLENSVQIFFVTSDGHVSTFSAPETLRIFKFQEDQEDSTTYFLQVGGWTHPLIQGASPCLQAENGAIMFPDIYSDIPNNSVGLVMTESVSPDQRQQLMSLLERLTALKSQTLLPPEQQLGALGATIVKGAELMAQGIEVGAEKAGQLIEYVTERSQEKMTKAEEDAKVGKMVRGSVDIAKTATTATVKVSGAVADRVGKLTKSLASYLAAKATPSSTGVGGKKKSGAMAYLVDAARGGLIGYGTVYNGLESSAKVLGANVKENSVKVVSHKYGGEAGGVFGEACTAAGNAAMTYINVQSLGVKGLVKKTAKQTGKNVVKNILTDSSGKPVTTQ